MIRLIHSLSTWISGIWGKSCLIILAVPSFILGILVCCEVSNTHDIGARRNKRLWLITYKIWFLSEIWFMSIKCFIFLAGMAGWDSILENKTIGVFCPYLFRWALFLWYLLYGLIFLLKAIHIQESLRIANVFNRCGS